MAGVPVQSRSTFHQFYDFTEGKAGGADEHCRNSKRHAIRNQPPLKKEAEQGQLTTFSHDQVIAEYSRPGAHHVILGKTLCEKLRDAAKLEALDKVTGFGKAVPEGLNAYMAPDLKQELDDLLA